MDRIRFVALMCLPGLWPPYRTRLRRYLELLDRLYRAVAKVAGPEVIGRQQAVSHAFLLRRVPGMDLGVVRLVRDSRGVALSWTRLLRRPEVIEGEAMMPLGLRCC